MASVLIWLLRFHVCVFVYLMARVAFQFVCTLGKEYSMGRALSVFIYIPFRKHPNAGRTGKPLFGVEAFSPFLHVLEVPSEVLLDYVHLALAGEFVRRLNICLDHQCDNGFLSQSKAKVDSAPLNVKFQHNFNQKSRPINGLKR